jgi:uncharacterized membrane protein (DUF485 family)
MFKLIKREMDASRASANFVMIITMMTILYLCGFIVIGAFAATTSGSVHWGEVFTILLIIAIAAIVVGFMLGFLFGIPRISEETSELLKDMTERFRSGKTPIPPSLKYRVNTNLEQVSDWLTKILVGIGLTQFNTFKDSLVAISGTLATTIPGLQHAQPVIIGSIVCYSLMGFFEGYLLARLIMPAVFAEADRGVQKRQTNFENLVNLEFDFTSLKRQEKALLKNIITAFESGDAFVLPEDFDNTSEQFYSLINLEERYLIAPKGGVTWESEVTVILTPIAQELLEKIKKELSE